MAFIISSSLIVPLGKIGTTLKVKFFFLAKDIQGIKFE